MKDKLNKTELNLLKTRYRPNKDHSSKNKMIHSIPSLQLNTFNTFNTLNTNYSSFQNDLLNQGNSTHYLSEIKHSLNETLLNKSEMVNSIIINKNSYLKEKKSNIRLKYNHNSNSDCDINFSNRSDNDNYE